MSQRVDLSQYYTRRQSDARYLRDQAPPEAPTALTVVGHGVFTSSTTQEAYLDLTLTDPVTPIGMSSSAYVQAYVFEVSFQVYTAELAQTVPLSFLLAKNTVYRLSGLPCNTLMTVTAATVDHLGRRSGPSTPLTPASTTDSDTQPPDAPAITADPFPNGALIAVGQLNRELDFNHYELWRGRGYDAATSTWTVIPQKVFAFVGTVATDVSIPSTQNDWYYYVRAVDSSGNATDSNIDGPLALTYTGKGAPPRPSLATAHATANSNGTITFAFTGLTALQAPALSKYRIWRKTNGAWLLLDTVSAVPDGAEVAYVDVRASNGQTYYYAVSAVNDVFDESSYDDMSQVHATAQDSDTPGAASALVFTGRLGGLDLAWTRSSSPDTIYYKLRYQTTGGFEPWLLVEGNTYSLLGLTAPRDALANVLRVELVAFDGVNESDTYAATVTYPALANYRPADDSIPPMPLNQVAIPNADGSATIQWEAPSILDLAGYEIDIQERNSGVYFDWQLLATVMDPTAGTKRFTDVGLEYYKFTPVEYRYRVRTIDTSGNLSPVNLLNDPSFDEAVTSWNKAIPHGTGRAGGYAAQVCYADAFSQTVPATAGMPYTLSGYLRQDSVAAASALLAIDWLDGLGGLLDQTFSTVFTSTVVFTRQHVTATAPAGTVWARCRVLGSSATPSTVVLWDDVQCEENFEPSLYAPGTTVFIRAVDTEGPPDYALDLMKVEGLGYIGLRWMNPPAAQVDYINGFFEVWRSADNTTFTKLDEVPATNDGGANGFDDNSPDETEAETWFYRLKARDRFGNVGPWLNGPTYSIEATSKTLNDFNILQTDGLTPLWGPTGVFDPALTATANLDGTITLNWHEATTAARQDLAGYNIWRKRSFDATTGEATAKSVATRVGSVTAQYGHSTMTWTEMPPLLWTWWDYAITAFDNQLEESGTDPAAFTFVSVLAVDSRPPLPPTNFRGTSTLGGVNLSWNPSSSPGVTRYEIFIPKCDGVFAPDTVTVDGIKGQLLQTAGTTLIVMLPIGPPKRFVTTGNFAPIIRAVREAAPGLGIPSTQSSWEVLSSLLVEGYIPVDSTPPSPPSEVKPVAPPTWYQLVLGWKASVSPDVNRYVVEVKAPGMADWYTVSTAAGNSTGCFISGLTQGETYTFRVSAIDNANNSSGNPDTGFGYGYSELIAIPVLVTKPERVTIYNIDQSPQGEGVQLVVMWEESTDSAFHHYEIRWGYNDNGGLSWQTDWYNPGSISAADCDETLNNMYWDEDYCFSVRQVNTAGLISEPYLYLSWKTGPSGSGGSGSGGEDPGGGGGTLVPGPTIRVTRTLNSDGMGQYGARFHIWFTDGTGATPSNNYPVGIGYFTLYVSADGGASYSQFGDTRGTATASEAYDYYREGQSSAIEYRFKAKAMTSGGVALSDYGSEVYGTSTTCPAYYAVDPDPSCYAVEMFLTPTQLVGAATPGMLVDGVSDEQTESIQWPIQTVTFDRSHCVRLTTENGASVVVSCNTPITVRDGNTIWAAAVDRDYLLTDVGQGLEWSRCHVEHMAAHRVARIALGGHTYRAAEVPGKWVYTHNFTKSP